MPEISAYHRARYVGPNLVVSAAGSVEHEAIVELEPGAQATAVPGTVPHLPTVKTSADDQLEILGKQINVPVFSQRDTKSVDAVAKNRSTSFYGNIVSLTESPLVEGFAAGKFNLVHLLKPIPVWMRYNNNFPVKIMSWAHINGSALVVGKHTGAEDFKDLGGLHIAVPYWYSMHNIVLQMGLREAGLKPVIKDQTEALAKDQVNLMIMPPPDMPPSIQNPQKSLSNSCLSSTSPLT